MTLTSGRFIGHEYDRLIARFSRYDGAREIPSAISTCAMDSHECGQQVRSEQWGIQLTRLRDRIEGRAASKYRATEIERHTARHCAARHRFRR